MKKINSCLLLFLGVILSWQGFSQNYYKITGIVTDTSGKPIQGVSIRIKNDEAAFQTNSKGKYILSLEQGYYTLTFSILSHEMMQADVVLNQDVTRNIVLLSSEKELVTVNVKASKRDRATQIMRNAIASKDRWQGQVKSCSYNLYLRASDETKNTRIDKKTKDSKLHNEGQQSIPDSVRLMIDFANSDSTRPQMNLVEAQYTVHWQTPNKLREIKQAGKVAGNKDDLFFLSNTEGRFDFYKNTFYSKFIGPNTFVSPLNNNALLSYKFDLKGSYMEDGRIIYRIKIIPRMLGNALFSGEIHIVDGLWNIRKVELEFPKGKTVEFAKLRILQDFKMQDSIWVLDRMEFCYLNKTKKDRTDGRTVCYYSNYKLNKTFPKNFFGNELSTTLDDAYDKDSAYWDSTRREPLTVSETKFLHYTDSVKEAHNKKEYLDSLDSVYNKVTWLNILWEGQGRINRARQEYYFFPSFTEVVLNGLVSPGGARMSANFGYYRKYINRRSLSLSPNINYGTRNNDLKGAFSVGWLYNPKKRAELEMSAGRVFDLIYAYDAYVNLLRRSNFFVSNYFSIDHTQELLNGLYLTADLTYNYRESIDGLKFGRIADSIFANNNPIAFSSYGTVVSFLRLRFVPYQKYIREPKEKIILGSRWPTFSLTWRKGYPKVFGSILNFDYLELFIRQKLILGIFGNSEYSMRSGKFLNKESIQLMDRRIVRRGDPYFFTHPLQTFQSLDTSMALYNWYFEGHYIHRFNGFLTQKIPGFKKLDINELVGAGILQTFETDNPDKRLHNLFHAELFFGLEKTIKINRYRYRLGVYYVLGYTNQHFARDLNYPSGNGFKFSIEAYNPRTNQFFF